MANDTASPYDITVNHFYTEVLEVMIREHERLSRRVTIP